MKNLIRIIQITPIFVFLFTSCGKSSLCEHEEIGNIPLSERADRFVPFQDGEKYYYKDQNGTVLAFQHTVSYWSGDWIWIRKIGEYEYDDFISGSGTTECYEYYTTSSKKNSLKTADNEYSMHASVSNKTESIHSSNDILSFAFGHKQESAYGRYNIESDSIETPAGLMKLDSVELNGKTFTDVLRAKNVGNDLSIYLKEGQGIIGFEVDSKVFVLQ